MNPRLIALVAITFGVLPAAQAQVRRVVTGGTFTPAWQVLFATDFSQDALGNFPAGLKYLSGPLEVVQLEGVHLLRSIGPAEFLIPLSQPLPQNFTLEFELIARNSNCCSGEELAFEGGPRLDRSAGSAWVAWHHQYTGIIGGGQDLGTSTVRFSEDLQGELIGQRALIQVMMSGTQFSLFTNGRQVANVPNLVFRRSTVLRVYSSGSMTPTGPSTSPGCVSPPAGRRAPSRAIRHLKSPSSAQSCPSLAIVGQIKKRAESVDVPVSGGQAVTTVTVVWAWALVDNAAGVAASYECSLLGFSGSLQNYDSFSETQANPAFQVTPTPVALSGSFVW